MAARDSFDSSTPPASAGNPAAYDEGYSRMVREYQWARRHGVSPTQRQLVVAFMHAARVYVSARGGRPIAGQHPDALRGRADALRDIIRGGAGRLLTEPERD